MFSRDIPIMFIVYFPRKVLFTLFVNDHLFIDRLDVIFYALRKPPLKDLFWGFLFSSKNIDTEINVNILMVTVGHCLTV